ncbi:hypothetical protein [Psychrobacter sp. DM4]|uniref:hypothetical protein n=1 Tax=Psychrobacter sp. DM4 TaxID=3440637 RepID=UPI003F504803
MKGSLELLPQQSQTRDEGVRRCCLLAQISASGERTDKQLWFLYPSAIAMPEDDNCDSYLLAVLLPAMQMRLNIIVHGSISSALLANLTEFQQVWKKWSPEQFFLVDIQVKSIRECETKVAGAIVAFSGGADAQFTAYRHATGKAGYSSQRLKAGVFIHGFDISLSDEKGFIGAKRLASAALEDLDIKLFTVSTNIRELWSINWESYFGSALASVLCAFYKYAGVGLIAGGPSYSELFMRMGDHPMLDPMLSSGVFQIMHDGCGFDRTEKIRTLSAWSCGVRNLRVCWEGDNTDRNCGECEKCVRTRLNFLIAGVKDPTCFSTPLKTEHLKRMILSSSHVISEWERILLEMTNATVDSKWIHQVQKTIKRNPPLIYLLPQGTRRRKLLTKLKGRIIH